jgi:pyruvate/2-oxoglutarate/acetoin dehydrogenase E1 component
MTSVLESLRSGLEECLAKSPQVVLLGEDVLDPYGGAFKATRGLSTLHPEQVITTPVSEAAIVGVATGMAVRGQRPVVEIMFGDFLMLAADQLVNHAAKLRWMSQDRVRVPLVVRTPMGGRRGYGPTHSQSLEKHFLGVPGLRVLALNALEPPALTVARAVLEDDDPDLLIEHKLLYPLPVAGAAERPEFEVRDDGSHYPTFRLRLAGAPAPALTLASYGYMAELALQAAHQLAYEQEIFTEVVIFTQLAPFELAPLIESVEMTRTLLSVEEGGVTLGWGAEVAALAAEHFPRGLTVRRLAARQMPIPASAPLEEAVLPSVRQIVEAAAQLASSARR